MVVKVYPLSCLPQDVGEADERVVVYAGQAPAYLAAQGVDADGSVGIRVNAVLGGASAKLIVSRLRTVLAASNLRHRVVRWILRGDEGRVGRG
jgi:hypothetical protein